MEKFRIKTSIGYVKLIENSSVILRFDNDASFEKATVFEDHDLFIEIQSAIKKRSSQGFALEVYAKQEFIKEEGD